MVTEPVLEQITDLIVRIARPKKVLLLGSQANGTGAGDSSANERFGYLVSCPGDSFTQAL